MKWYKKIAFVLACVLCFGVAACSHKTDAPAENGGQQGAAPVNPVRDSEQHYVEGGLHKVNVTESSRPFVVNGVTEYKIVVGREDSDIEQAVTYLKKNIAKATDADLEVVYYNEGEISYDANAKYIVVECPALFAAAGLTMPADNLGQTGYYIKSAGNSVFLATVGVFGYQSAVISFLHHVVGYEMYADDLVVFEKTGETLPDMDIIEKPDFEFRLQGNGLYFNHPLYGMGYMREWQVMIPVDGLYQHNVFAFLPPATYKNDHSEWYSADETQLCYTAHGDPDEYEEMADTVFNRIVQLLAQYPNVGNITFTQMDGNTKCECEACNKIVEEYGSISAAQIRLCNTISRKVQTYLEEQAEANGTEKRDFNIIFFAYQRSEKAPAAKDENGNWQPIDQTVVCDEHVGVYIAPLYGLYSHSFYSDENASAAQTVDSWRACAQKLYMWLYEPNYHHYMYPLNSYESVIETYRFCFERGATYMFTQGQQDNPGRIPHFTKLKEYLNIKAEFDVNVDTNALIDAWFENYFKEAAEPMRQFFDEMQTQFRYLEEAYPAEVTGGIYDNIAQERFWPKRMLEHWLELCDEAYAAIEPYKTSAPEMYDILRGHILAETMFPRYALIELHAGKFTANELQQMRVEFKQDTIDLNLTNVHEHDDGKFDVVFSEWNV